MKLQNDNISSVFTNNLENVQDFKIAFNGKAFKVLLDGMYPNKIKAVIRELCTNAYDAHSAAGKRHIPFDVHMPTIYSPVFHVRDYGISMDNDQVLHLYSTLFQSSKENNNTEVGMLGLGSKAPFAYADSFTTITWIDGKKRTYRAWMGEDRIPKIVLLGEEDSTEPQGVMVSVDVHSMDINAFKENAEKLLKYFTVTPNITGNRLNITRDTELLSGNSWYLVSKTAYNQTIARQGCVVYPINTDSIPNLSVLHAEILRSGFVIDFPIGTLDVAPSREELSYGPQTCHNIVARLNTIVEEITKKYSEEASKAETAWEACSIYNKIDLMGLPTCIKSVLGSFVWKGTHRLDSSVLVNTALVAARIVDISTRLYYASSWTMKRKKKFDFSGSEVLHGQAIKMGSDITILARINSDRPSNEGLRISQHKNSKDLIIVTADTEAGIIEVMSQFGDPKFIWTKDLPKAVIVKTVSATKLVGKTKPENIKANRVVYFGPPRRTSYLHNDANDGQIGVEELVTLDQDAYYIPLSGGKIVGWSDINKSSWLGLAESLEHVNNLNLIDEKYPVYFVNAIYIDRVKKNSRWKNLEEVVCTNILAFKDRYIDSRFRAKIAETLSKQVNDNTFRWLFFREIQEYINKYPDSLISSIEMDRKLEVSCVQNGVSTSTSQNKSPNIRSSVDIIYTVDNIIKLLGYYHPISVAVGEWRAISEKTYATTTQKFEDLRESFNKTYPLLTKLDVHTRTNSSIKIAVDYISVIDDNHRMRKLLNSMSLNRLNDSTNPAAIAAE